MACVTYLDYMARAKSAMIWLPSVVIWTILALHAAAYFQCEVPGNRLCRLDVLEEGNWVHEPRGKMMRLDFCLSSMDICRLDVDHHAFRDLSVII